MASIYRLQYPKSAQNTRGTGYISPFNAGMAKNFELALAEAERRAGLEAANVEARRAYVEATADALRKEISSLRKTRLDLIEGDIDRNQAANDLRFKEAGTNARAVYGAQMRARPTVSTSTAVSGTPGEAGTSSTAPVPQVSQTPKSRDVEAALRGSDPNMSAPIQNRVTGLIGRERIGTANQAVDLIGEAINAADEFMMTSSGVSRLPVAAAAARVTAVESVIARAANDMGVLPDDVRAVIIRSIDHGPVYKADLMTLQAIGGNADDDADDDDGPTTRTTTRTTQQVGAEAELKGTADLQVEDSTELQKAIDAEITKLTAELEALELPEEVTTDLIDSARQIYHDKFSINLKRKKPRASVNQLLSSSLTAADLDRMMEEAAAKTEPEQAPKPTPAQEDQRIRMDLMMEAINEGEPLDMDTLPTDSIKWSVIELYNSRGDMSNEDLTNMVLMDFPAKDRAEALTTLYQMINDEAGATNAAQAIPSPEVSAPPRITPTNATP